MVDLTRRKTVIGLGLLATGSGATFTSAAFASQVSPASDMRVVVGQEFSNSLRVEAGDIFRDGSGSFTENLSDAVKTTKRLDTGGTSFFTSDDERNPLDTINVDDLPAAGANDGTNGGLGLAVATKVGEDETIGDGGSGDNGFIQVVNNTPDDHKIGIRFAEFGEDVSTPGRDRDVSRQQVFDTYQFKSARTNQRISSNGFADGEQNIPNQLTIESGTTEQIYLEVDTKEHSDAILDATEVADSPFTNEQDTVDLVDSIRVGTTEESINGS